MWSAKAWPTYKGLSYCCSRAALQHLPNKGTMSGPNGVPQVGLQDPKAIYPLKGCLGDHMGLQDVSVRRAVAYESFSTKPTRFELILVTEQQACR